jgi:hypothetical protein
MTEKGYVAIYSDVSIRKGVAAYCVAIVENNSGKPQYHTGLMRNACHSTVCEFSATAIGMNLAPISERAVVFSDVEELPDIVLGREVSYWESLAAPIDSIRSAQDRFFSVDYRLVNRGNGYYIACHIRARKRAALEILRAGAELNRRIPSAQKMPPFARGKIIARLEAALEKGAT